ncbi:DUF4097 family beta strand repeat-containing protein [Promethearchaeum syntrophicum]|uniref:DUF4097 family beta strand repeat-containing protein n=1 Tax=Promethearchaeum syntrophicum TaxID=2594042 RepID=A0A5B9DBW5_9ARCH|nr:DUF4097 family beta strand repeat-containing protein [Candidatus Prometheoarchaeum syntrophicum]QEE16769.1 hypothetical protein DSAG12_02599 [Candidatus Prometheoarchaeum syntrophicum]
MSYCFNCGENIEPGTEYCSHCGSRLENIEESSPQPEKYVEKPHYTPNDGISNNSAHSGRIRKRKLGKSIALLLIVTMVLSGGSLFAFANSYEIQAERSYTYESEEIPSELGFIFDVSSAEIVFQFNSTPIDDIVKIDANFNFTIHGFEESSLEEIYDIVWETSESSVLFGIYRDDWFHWTMWDQSVITVTLRTDIVYDLDIDTGSGSVLVNVPEGEDFKNLDIFTGSGCIDVNINGSSNIANDLHLNTGSGNIDLDINSGSSIANDLNLDTGSGRIHVDIENSSIDNSFVADTGSGSMEIILNDVDLSNSLILETGSGGMDIYIANSKLSNGIYSDTGSGGVDYRIINTTLGGNLDVQIGSGGFNLISVDLFLENDVFWNIDGGSGHINVELTQHDPLGGLITGNIDTGSGGVSIILDINSTIIPSNWECDVGSGDILFDLENPTGYIYTDESLTSQSFDGTLGFDLFIETGSGSITIYN